MPHGDKDDVTIVKRLLFFVARRFDDYGLHEYCVSDGEMGTRRDGRW